jgi:TRAP-type C4-dicarboxylate transport system permease large subunit
VAAILVSLLARRLTWQGFKLAVYDTVRVTCMIFALVLGGVIFGRFLAATRLPYEMAQWAGEQALPAILILLIICFIYIIGGMLLDALALLVITIPIFFPLAEKLGFDQLWFAILITLVTTMGAVTPPVAINVFVVAGMCPGIALDRIFRGVTYFILAYLLCITVLIAFPGIATIIPSMVR